MINILDKSETPGNKRPRMKRNLLFSTQFNALLQTEGNRQPILEYQNKFGKTDEEILNHIISEFSA